MEPKQNTHTYIKRKKEKEKNILYKISIKGILKLIQIEMIKITQMK